MNTKIYGLHTLEFLNASIDEIYHRKKHYATGKDSALLKGIFSAEFVKLERMFKAVYFSDISLCWEHIDQDLFARQFPFVYEHFANKNYLFVDNQEQESIVNGITYYTSILEELRNINLHAIISAPIAKTFKMPDGFFDVFPKISESVLYVKNGQLTIAGMFIMLFAIIRDNDLESSITNFINIWGESIWNVVEYNEKRVVKEEIATRLTIAFKTNYDTPIRTGISTSNILENVFGVLNDSLVLEQNNKNASFTLDISKRAKSPWLGVEGEIVYESNQVKITIKKGSNIGTYFSNDFTLVITDILRFNEYSHSVAPFMFIAYLYNLGIASFTTETEVATELLSRLNYPKFYRDKDLNILCFGNKNADIREINKSISEGLLKLFLNFEERMIFILNIDVYVGYSKLSRVLETLNVPKSISEKILLIRNFAAHYGMLNNYHCFSKTRCEKITIQYVLDSIFELILWLNNNNYQRHSSFLHDNFHQHILNNIIGVKYRRLIDKSAQLCRYKQDKTLEIYDSLQKSFLPLDNSVISKADEEKILAYSKGTFTIKTKENSLINTPEGVHAFTRIKRLIFEGEQMELNGKLIVGNRISILQTPKFNIDRITIQGKIVKWEIVKQYSMGLQDYFIYQSKK